MNIRNAVTIALFYGFPMGESLFQPKIYVVGLGYKPFEKRVEERIIQGTPEEMAAIEFSEPNVVIILRR